MKAYKNSEEYCTLRTVAVNRFRERPSKDVSVDEDSSLLNQCGDCSDCACQVGTRAEICKASFPSIYSLELTPACNNRCPGCGNVFLSRTAGGGPLSAERWEAVLDLIGPHVRKLKVTGGEPALHPEFFTIIRAIARRGIPFTLFTNARWSEPDRILSLLRDTSQCMGLLISLHGCDVDSHEAFSSVCGSFQETVENIRRAVDAGLVVATSTVLTRYNVLRLEEIVDFALSLGAQHAVFNRYLGASLPSVEPTMEELRDGILVLESMIRSGAPVRYGNPVPQCFAFNSSRGCAAGKSYCTIDPWGNLRPCNHSPTIVGNLFEQSLEALWHSDGMEQWRALIPSECQSCPEVAACSGGCKALAELRVERCDPLNSRRVGIDNVSPSQLNQKTRSVVLQEVKHGF